MTPKYATEDIVPRLVAGQRPDYRPRMCQATSAFVPLLWSETNTSTCDDVVVSKGDESLLVHLVL